MARDPEIPERELSTADVTAIAPPPKRGLARRHWGKLTLFVLLGVPALALTIWSYAALNFSYSKGNRVGFVQKISRKGWICKTWEGDLQVSSIPGSAPVIFPFTVRGDSIAQAIEGALGRQVELTYEEHKGVILSCFGETQHYVVGVKAIPQ